MTVTYRALWEALENADRIRDELPFLVQPEQTSFDMVTLAAEIRRLQTNIQNNYGKKEDPRI